MGSGENGRSSRKEKLKDHEKRIRWLEKSISEVKGELRFNTALTLVVLGAVLSLIILTV